MQDPGMFNAILSHFAGGNFGKIPVAYVVFVKASFLTAIWDN